MILRLKLIFVFIFSVTGLSFGQIWQERFDLPDGTDDDPAPPSIWYTDVDNATITPPNDYFAVQSGQMEAKDVDGEVIWYSEMITITGQSNVAISMLVSESGGMESDDYLRAYYVLDGVEVLFGEVTDDITGGGPISLSIGGLNGDDLEIIVKINNNGANERWRFDDVTVSIPAVLYSISSGNWSDGANWSYNTNGPACTCVPSSLSQVEIEGADQITYDETTGILGLHLSGSAQLIWGGAGSSLTIDGVGIIEVDAGSSISSNGNTSAEILFSSGGSLINNDTGSGITIENISVLGTNSLFDMSGSGGLIVLNNLAIGGNSVTVTNNLSGLVDIGNNLSFPANTLSSSLVNNGDISISSDLLFNHDECQLINNGQINITDDLRVGGNSDINNSIINNTSGEIIMNEMRLGSAPGFILDNYGLITLSDDILSADAINEINNLSTGQINYGGNNPSAQIVLNASSIGNTVDYNGTSTINIIPPQSSYYNLQISGLSTKTITTTTSIDGDLTIASDLNMASNDINLKGNLNSTGTFTTGTNTIFFIGASQNITSNGNSFNNVEISSNVTATLLDDIDINGDLTIQTTLEPSSPGRQLFLAGNFINNGSLINGGEIIFFDGGADQTVNGTSNTVFDIVKINKSAGSLSFNSSVELRGSLDILSATLVDLDGTGSGIFKLVSNASYDARISELAAGASLSGNMLFEKYFTGIGSKYWRHIGSPVTGATIADLQAEIPISGTFTGNNNGFFGIPLNANPSLYYYDPTAGLVSETLDDRWIVYPTSTNNEVLTGLGSEARGYAIWVRDTGPITYNLTGTANFGTVDYNISAANEGWNLIANPYPSAIDWSSTNTGWSITDIQGSTIHIWNGSGYLTWNGSTGSLPNGYIAKGQGFWVQAVDGGAPQLISTEAVKTSEVANTYRLSDEPEPIIEITLDAGGFQDKTHIQFNQKGKLVYDAHDANKLRNAIFNLATMTPGGIPLSINVMNVVGCETGIPLKIDNTWADSYRLSINPADVIWSSFAIQLKDNLDNKVYSITKENSIISFDITDELLSQQTDRFTLLIEPKALNENVIIEVTQDCEFAKSALVNLNGTQLNASYEIYINGSLDTTLLATSEELEYLAQGGFRHGANNIRVRSLGIGCLEDEINYEKVVSIMVSPIISYDQKTNLLVSKDNIEGIWYRNEERLYETPSAYIEIDNNNGGVYVQKVSNERCSRTSNEFLVTSSVEEALSNKISISPNPAVTQVSVSFSGKVDKLRITDISGRIYYENLQLLNEVDISNFDSGIYFVTIYSGQEKFTQRFIKQ